jgi:hypothetical protein
LATVAAVCHYCNLERQFPRGTENDDILVCQECQDKLGLIFPEQRLIVAVVPHGKDDGETE